MKKSVVACICVLGLAVPACAQVFVGVGTDAPSPSSRALAISDDGTTVVGQSNGPFRWTLSTGRLGLGPPPAGFQLGAATGVSGDGTTLVGWMTDGTNSRIWRWSASTGAQQVGGLTFLGIDPRISSDAQVILGESGVTGFPIPARWTAATGAVPIPALSGLPTGRTGSAIIAGALSADGSIIAGTARINLTFPNTTNNPYLWPTSASTATVILNNNAFLNANATDLSADGSVMVAILGNGLFRWTQATGYTFLGTTANPSGLEARTSADGSAALFGTIFWSASDGTRPLTTVLSAAGANFAGWSNLVATDLSANGLTLCGYGTNPQGQTEGWYATIPAPASLLTLLALPLTTRRRRTCTSAMPATNSSSRCSGTQGYAGRIHEAEARTASQQGDALRNLNMFVLKVVPFPPGGGAL